MCVWGRESEGGGEGREGKGEREGGRGKRERAREYIGLRNTPTTHPTPPQTVNGLHQVRDGRRFKRSFVSNAVGSLGPKKGAGQRMRVPKAKGIIRHYFKPSPFLPSLHLSTLFTHKSRRLLMCVHGHITFPSISQSFYDRHPYSHPQQNSSCEAEGGGGVLEGEKLPFLSKSSSWPVLTHSSLAPLFP